MREWYLLEVWGVTACDDGATNTITPSNILNFTDKLCSYYDNERIFVFTTNHVEKLDPTLLRKGNEQANPHELLYFSNPQNSPQELPGLRRPLPKRLKMQQKYGDSSKVLKNAYAMYLHKK
nr:AAA-ATPase At5g57480-like [Ipomoea batatas]